MSLSSQRFGPNLREVPSATSGRFLLQRFSEVFIGSQRFSEVFRGFQRFTEIFRDFQSKRKKPLGGFVVGRSLAECLGQHCWRVLPRVVMS